MLRRVPNDAELGGLRSRAEWQVRLSYWDRQPDSMLQVLATVRDAVFEQQNVFLPRSL